MTLTIELVTREMYKEIFDFEKKNKDHFESILPPRPQGYNRYSSFVKIMDNLMLEQNDNKYLMFIIRDEKNRFVGRINLQIVSSQKCKKAEVGYRIDFLNQGKGYANKALALLIQKSFLEYEIEELTAGTAKDNLGSIRVLEKNGFKKIGEEKNVLKINNRWVDGVLYATKNTIND